MLKPGDIAIVSGARTPMGRYCGKLKDFTAMELGAIAAKEVIERAGLEPKEFDHAVFGNAQHSSFTAARASPYRRAASSKTHSWSRCSTATADSTWPTPPSSTGNSRALTARCKTNLR